MAGRRGVRTRSRVGPAAAAMRERERERERAGLLSRRDPLQHQWNSGCYDRSRTGCSRPLSLSPFPSPQRRPCLNQTSLPPLLQNASYANLPATQGSLCLPLLFAYLLPPVRIHHPLLCRAVGSHRLAFCPQFVTDRASVRFYLVNYGNDLMLFIDDPRWSCREWIYEDQCRSQSRSVRSSETR